MKPSEQQVGVYDWVVNDKGSLELVARAGCGKTTTLMEVVKLIVTKSLGNIALMAYNSAIANELKERISKSNIDWKAAQAGTCHSFGFSAWRQMAPNVVVEEKKVKLLIQTLQSPKQVEWNIYDRVPDTIEHLVSLGKQRAIGHLKMTNDMNEWFDIWNHFGLDEEVGENVNSEEVIKAAIHIYKMSLNQCKEVIDFDDMILAPLYFRAKFWPKDWVLVDESQDTNPARRALALAMLKPRTGRMIFVGDQYQAIYGFTGADSDSMELLKKATRAKSLPLSVTYRCPKAIVKEAQKIVSDIYAHESAPQGAVEEITYAEMFEEGLNKSDVILCRNTAPLITAAYDLIGKGIACQVEGREIGTGIIKLAQRFEVKTLMELSTAISEYLQTQSAKYMSKNQEEKIQGLEDQVDCLKVVIARCYSQKIYSVDGLVKEVELMFGNTPPGEDAKVLKLCTIHKSKGREWNRVFIIGREKYMPSPYAKKEWQQTQESNLAYVAYTRAKQELFFVSL